ncbi:MAG: hypothetical protein HRU11_05330 [Parvularculaceae bacterium]|nr:hypothetical protein [Parvularculaceae bacterium]
MLFQYYLVAALILGLWFGAYRYWRSRIDPDISAGANFDWDLYQRKDPDLLKGLDEASFTSIYRRVETPRGPIHVFYAVAAFLIGAPLVLALNTLIIRFMERTGIIPQPAEQARQLRLTADGIQIVERANLDTLQYILQGWGGFFTFFSLLIFWVIVFYVSMRRLHQNRPGSLREEILRAR